MSIVSRLAFASLGGFGVASVVPNVMMIEDTNDVVTMAVSKMCLGGSVFMMASGLFGMFHHSKYFPLRIACYTGGIGLGLQFIPLIAAKFYRSAKNHGQ